MKEKPVIYLLPGLLCDQQVWQFQDAALKDAAKVRIPDFRGMNSLAAMAESVLADAPANFSVVGHSMGARVALELINKAPERIKDLVLISTGVHPVTDQERKQRNSLVKEAASVGMEHFAANWADLMLGNSTDEDSMVRECIESMAKHQTLENFSGHINAGLGRKDQSEYLPGIQIPVLLIVGEQDVWSPVSQHEAIAAQLPSASLEIVPGGGHMVILDQAEAVNQLLRKWLFRK